LLCGVLRNVRDNARHLDSFRFFEIGNEIHKPRRRIAGRDSTLGRLRLRESREGSAQLMEAKRLAECLLPVSHRGSGRRRTALRASLSVPTRSCGAGNQWAGSSSFIPTLSTAGRPCTTLISALSRH
jgi:hypothetical protein